MNKNYSIIGGIVGFLVLIALFIGGSYNSLVGAQTKGEQAQSKIETALQRRYDLIPNVVNSVKGYMKHESETLTKITQARTAAMSAQSIDQKIAAENQLSAALRGLTVSVEAYPDLKANPNFMQLQEEMADIENKLAAVRRYFNSATKEYNNAVETFPANLVAGMFGFRRETMFDLGSQRAQLEEAPKINF